MKTSRYLWLLIRYRPFLYVGNGLVWLLVFLLPLLPGVIMQQFFNALERDHRLDGSILLLVAILLARVSLNLLAHLLTLPGNTAVPGTAGDVLNRIEYDVYEVEDTVCWTIEVIGKAFFAGIAIAILLHINVMLTLFVFFPMIGVAVLPLLINQRIEAYHTTSRLASGRVSSAISEIFRVAQAIKVAGAQEQVVASFQRISEQRRVALFKDQLLTHMIHSIFSNIVGLGTGLILILAEVLPGQNHVGVGDLAIFLYYLAFVTDFTRFFGHMAAQYSKAKVAFARMAALL